MSEGGVVPTEIMKYENSELFLNKHNSEIMKNDSKRMGFQFRFIHI